MNASAFAKRRISEELDRVGFSFSVEASFSLHRLPTLLKDYGQEEQSGRGIGPEEFET